MTPKFIFLCIIATVLAPVSFGLSFLLLVPAYEEVKRKTHEDGMKMLEEIKRRHQC